MKLDVARWFSGIMVSDSQRQGQTALLIPAYSSSHELFSKVKMTLLGHIKSK